MLNSRLIIKILLPNFYINNIFVIFFVVIKTRALMNNDEELKSRIEELEQDLIFYQKGFRSQRPRERIPFSFTIESLNSSSVWIR